MHSIPSSTRAPKRKRTRAFFAACRLCGFVFGATVFAAGWIGPLSAQDQSRGADALRAVVTFNPTTGERSTDLLRPLTPDERLRVEAALEEAGSTPGRVDGVFDDRTEEALADLQRREGLPVCGCVDVSTLARLGVPTRTVMTTLAGAEDASSRQVEMVYPNRPSPSARSGGRRTGPGQAAGTSGEERPATGPSEDEPRAERSRPTRPGRPVLRSPFLLGSPALVPAASPPVILPPGAGEPASPRQAPTVGRLPARPLPPRRVPPPR